MIHYTPRLFHLDWSDRIIREEETTRLMNGLMASLMSVETMKVNYYRAGGALCEVIFESEHPSCLTVLTINEGELNMAPTSSEDIRVSHQVISLLDMTDVFVLVLELARYLQLTPSLIDGEDASLLFSAKKTGEVEPCAAL
ncbi:hypothetical protein AB4427_04415 [Vibrio artabrorum]|uniref:hypothetical protein n=1 Tax=Vibrio artabrorum TaxID=446374 RepID=UPI00355031D9